MYNKTFVVKKCLLGLIFFYLFIYLIADLPEIQNQKSYFDKQTYRDLFSFSLKPSGYRSITTQFNKKKKKNRSKST